MVFGILRMTNFAHGDMMMVGAFATLAPRRRRACPSAGPRSAASSSAALAGVIVERIAYRPVRGSPDVTLLLTSLGVTYILENLGILHLHQLAAQFSDPGPGSNSAFQLVGRRRSPSPQINLLTVVLTGRVAGCCSAGSSPAPTLGSACARRRRIMGAAHLVGLDVNRLIVAAFAIASAFAGLAGVLWAAQSGIVEPDMGFTPLLKAFVAAIIGGFGSIAGALLGGYLLGALEVCIVAFLPSDVSPYRDAIVFALLIAFLLFRPNGLLQPHPGGEAVSRPAAPPRPLLPLVARPGGRLGWLLPQLRQRLCRAHPDRHLHQRDAGHLDGPGQRLHRRVLAGPCRLRRRRRLRLRHPVAPARGQARLSCPTCRRWLGAVEPALPPGDHRRRPALRGRWRFVVGAPLMRLSGHFVSVATLGFLIIVNVVLVNADDYTRGARTFTGVPLETTLPWAVGWLALTLVVLARIVYSPDGRRHARRARGYDRGPGDRHRVLPTRLSAFVVGAFFAGVGGSLYGHYLGSFSPASFYFAYTFSLISMLVIGGMQSLTGAVLGVIVVTLASEVLRNLERGFDLGPSSVPPLYGASQIVLGIIFILVMIFRPSGLMGDRELTLGRIYSRTRRADRGGTCNETDDGLSGIGALLPQSRLALTAGSAQRKPTRIKIGAHST